MSLISSSTYLNLALGMISITGTNGYFLNRMSYYYVNIFLMIQGCFCLVFLTHSNQGLVILKTRSGCSNPGLV